MIKGMVSVIIPTTDKELRDAWGHANFAKDSNYDGGIESIIICEGKERSAQRNIGISRARGEFLLFLDSDQSINPDMIADCIKRIKYFGGVYIPEIVVGYDWFAKLRNWERSFYHGTAIDVCRFVRAYQCPRFDETLHGPEDTDFDRRIQGGKTISTSYIYHYENVSLWKYLRKKAYYARSMKRFAMRNPNDQILDWRWRVFGVFLERGKWKKFISKPHYVVAILALIFIRGIILLCAKKS